VHRAVCLFTSQHSPVLIAPTHGGMARLSWPGWLVTYQDGLPACRRSPIQVLTGPGVDFNFVDATNDVSNTFAKLCIKAVTNIWQNIFANFWDIVIFVLGFFPVHPVHRYTYSRWAYCTLKWRCRRAVLSSNPRRLRPTFPCECAAAASALDPLQYRPTCKQNTQSLAWLQGWKKIMIFNKKSKKSDFLIYIRFFFI